MTQAHFGLLGRTLAHSYTPTIYRELAGIDYVMFEREPEEVEAFLKGDEWLGTNVTIPYKRAVLDHLDELSDIAERLGNVNTITREADGRLKGDNTDYYGFECLLESLGRDLTGKKAVVFGANGGAGTTVCTVLADKGIEVVKVGRKGPVTYKELSQHADAALAVNCTPSGMYPACPGRPCGLGDLTGLEAVIDIVYNPVRTGLMLEAEALDIPHRSGLMMLVAQAALACERYLGKQISLERIAEVTELIENTEQNIALIGMPGSGKTRVGQNIARMLGREHVDIDAALEDELGCTCSSYIKRKGEDAFRARETEVLSKVAKKSRLVISTGGGIVMRAENYPLLHQNSHIVMLNRKLSELSRKNRPITQRDGIDKLAEIRMPMYRSWADVIVDSLETPAKTAQAAIELLPPMLSTTEE